LLKEIQVTLFKTVCAEDFSEITERVARIIWGSEQSANTASDWFGEVRPMIKEANAPPK
jgi:hypothetical protein